MGSRLFERDREGIFITGIRSGGDELSSSVNNLNLLRINYPQNRKPPSGGFL